MKPTYTTNSPISFPYPSITFNNANREVLRITQDGRLIIGEGLSTDEATQVAAKMLIDAFDEQIQKMLDARAAAELVTMNVPRREKAEADTARLDWLQNNKGQVGWTSGREPNLPVASTPSSFGVIGATVRAAIDAAMKEASK
jgi:hypothetical protein